MATIMTDSIKIMINVVEKHAVNNTEANFYELFQALTLDVIGNSAFFYWVCNRIPNCTLACNTII